MLVSDVIVFIAIHVVANSRSREELDEVGETYEEAPIFAVFAVHLLTRLHRPLARFVAPVTGPLLHAIRVTDLYQTVLVKIRICHYLRANQRISMAVLKAVFLDFFPRDLIVRSGVRTAAHGHFFLIRYVQALPKAVHVVYFIVVERRLWATCEWIKGLARRSCLNPLVATKNFGPSFLNNQHPDFRWSFGYIGPGRLRKCPRLRLIVIRKIIINNDSALLPIDVHLHGVAAGFINILCQENTLDTVGELGQGAQTRQKVTVSAPALLNIIRPWLAIKNESALSVDLDWPLPRETFPALVARLFPYVTV